MKHAHRTIRHVVTGLAVLAGLVLTVVTLLLCADVVIRYLQLANAPWIGDVASLSLFVVTFLAAPWVLLNRGHVAVDILINALEPALQRLARRAVNALGAVICTVLLVYAVRVLLESWETGSMVFRMLVYPQWYLFTLPPVTFGLMALIFILHAVDPENA